MTNTRYTEDHEWATVESDDVITVGITDFAQDQLGDIVYVDLPDVGDEFDMGDEFAVVESVKAAADVKAPVSGSVIEINELLEDAPELVNESPQEDGWFCKLQMSDASQLDSLMDNEQYEDYIAELE